MFRIKDYLVTPRDIYELIKRAWKLSHYSDWLGVLLLAIYALVFGLFFSLALEPLFFFGFIIAVIYFSLDSRIAIGLALACLVIVPLLLYLSEEQILFYGEVWAERVAVWAYYFLVIGVVKQIFEYRGEANTERKS